MNEKIKCVVFDLDGTLWEGTLAESDDVKLKKGVKELLEQLDRRGILMSLASKNNFDTAKKILCREGIFDYFLLPQISWNPKSLALEEISAGLNLSLREFAFVDDTPEERDEVLFAHPEVRVYDAEKLLNIPDYEEFCPKFVTEDSRLRRKLYQNDLRLKEDEKRFCGTNEEFLKTLGMKLTVSKVRDGDLERVEELTRRTHQLNSTGRTFSFEELNRIKDDENYIFLIVSLENRYGDCGKVGLALMEKSDDAYTVKLLIMSCRVMSLGIGSAMLVYLSSLALRDKKRLLADFVFTDRNRIMYITYKMFGFSDNSEEDAPSALLEWDGEARTMPEYFEIHDETGENDERD